VSDQGFLFDRDFATREQCADVIAAFHAASRLGLATRVIPSRTEVPGRALVESRHRGGETLDELRRAAVEHVRIFFDLAVCYPESTLLTEMRKGDRHVLHADAERELPDGGWGPNHTFWRTHTALLYLNTSGDAFEGGILRLPALEMEVVPAAGLLVGITCGQDHRHEVTEVTRGNRLSIAVWMTTDPADAEAWD
jgi:predicted 2-oxoglutarate/Fe(II)-dependent dioxygenase YbiX